MSHRDKPSIGADDLRRVTARLADSRRSLPDDQARHVLSIEEQMTALQQGDYEGMLQQAAPDVQFEIFAPPEFPFVRKAAGPQAMRDAIRHNFASVDDQRPTISNVVVQGDVVVLFGSETGRIRGAESPYHVEFVHRFTFKGTSLASIRIIVARV